MNDPIKQLLEYYREYRTQLLASVADVVVSQHTYIPEPTIDDFMEWLSEKVDQPNNTKAV